MNLLNILKRNYRKFGLNSKSFFKLSKERQLKYLNGLGEAHNPTERSYKQYKCQTHIMNTFFVFILNLFSFFTLPAFLFKIKNKKIIYKEKKDAIFISDGMPIDIIPESLLKKYHNIKTIKFTENLSITQEDIKYLKALKNWNKYSPYFKLKVYLKIAIYSAAIRLYNPSAFISYCESSFTSQIITEWLEKRNMKNINIMHGEKIFFISDSYAYFSEFFVWDEHYKKMFIELKADKKQFIIEKPKKFKNIELEKREEPFFLTYYLSDESKKEIKNITVSLNILKEKGMKCKVRLHPRGNNYNTVKKYMKGFIIEKPDEVELYQSFSNTKYLCALNSTVLYEGFILGKKIIIDDFSNKGKYKNQEKLDYIMLKKEHLLLSQLINEKNYTK